MRTLRGLWLLLCMVVRSRFRLGGAYWAWRRETALGKDDGAAGAGIDERAGDQAGDQAGGISRRDRLVALVEYARWLDRMRSISKV